MPITETQSVTGRGGNATVNSVTIGITSWSGTIRKAFDDSTDSNNFDATTGQTWTSQAPGVLGMDGSITGNFDLSGTTDTNFIQKFKTDGPYPVTLGVTHSVSFASFNADFTDVQTGVSVPGSTMVTWTANFKSNGIITFP